MIESLITIFAALVSEAIKAGDDQEKQEAALMSAEEKLAHLRAQKKFGSG